MTLHWAKLPTWIVHSGVLRDLPKSAPALLLALLSHADKDGIICVAQADAAHKVGMSVSTAKRAFSELASRGIVEIIEHGAGRKPSTIRVCGVTDDGSMLNGHGRTVMGDTATARDGSLLTGQCRGVNVDQSPATPLQPVDRSWVTPQSTHIGTGVRRKEKREREIISLHDLESWHPKSRLVFEDDESRDAFLRFVEVHPSQLDDTKAWQIVAMFLTRHPKALKVGWTIPKLVELAEAVDTHEHLTTAQALVEIDLLSKLAGDKKTKMMIPQVDEICVVLAKCERQNLSRKRYDESVGAEHDDQKILDYASSLNDGKRSTLLAGTREAMRFTQNGEQDIGLFWDSRREGNPLRIDWLGQDAGALWLRSRAAKFLENRSTTKAAKESA